MVYKRYASLYFVCGIDGGDNELITLEIIHHFVEVLDRYFGNVCELDLIFNFHKVSPQWSTVHQVASQFLKKYVTPGLLKRLRLKVEPDGASVMLCCLLPTQVTRGAIDHGCRSSCTGMWNVRADAVTAASDEADLNQGVKWWGTASTHIE